MPAFAIAVILLFLLFPVVSVPFAIIGFFYNPKYRIFYSIILALFMGLVAYNLDPPISYDLYRHHELVANLNLYGMVNFWNYVFDSTEPLQSALVYGVSLLNNPDILQFVIVSLGYLILLYCIGDFAWRSKINKRAMFLVLCLTLSSFTAINFFSGLWNYIAIIIFSLGFYLDFYRHKSRWIAYPLYLITPLIHSGMIFPVVLMIIFKVFKKKLNVFSFAVAVVLFAVPTLLLPVIASLSDITIFSQIESMYRAYFVEGDQFLNLYGGNVMIMELVKLSLYGTIAVYSYRSLKRNKDKTLFRAVSFVILLIAMIVVLIINSIVFLRFVLLVQFIAAPFMMHVLNRSKLNRAWIIFIGFVIVLSTIFSAYQYMTLSGLDFGPVNLKNIFAPSWVLLKQG